MVAIGILMFKVEAIDKKKTFLLITVKNDFYSVVFSQKYVLTVQLLIGV